MPSSRLGFAVAALVSAFSLFAASAAGAARPPIEVTACGQVIPSGRSAFLSANLTCPTTAGSVAVALGSGTKLDLRGFTITGGDAAVTCGKVVFSETAGVPPKSGHCEVFGGTITGASYEAIVGNTVTIRNMTIVDNFAYAVLAFHKADVQDSHVENTPNGVQANLKISVTGSTFVGAMVNSGRNARIVSSSVTGNAILGAVGSRLLELVASSVTGNGTDPDCGQINHDCADVASEHAPILEGASTCEHSLRLPNPGGQPALSWGVCTLD